MHAPARRQGREEPGDGACDIGGLGGEHLPAPGVVDPGELGLPGMHVKLVGAHGTAATATSDARGLFAFPRLGPGDYRVALDASNFRAGFGGVEWLGTKSLTPTSHLGETGRSLLTLPLVVISEIFADQPILPGFVLDLRTLWAAYDGLFAE